MAIVQRIHGAAKSNGVYERLYRFSITSDCLDVFDATDRPTDGDGCDSDWMTIAHQDSRLMRRRLLVYLFWQPTTIFVFVFPSRTAALVVGLVG